MTASYSTSLPLMGAYLNSVCAWYFLLQCKDY